MSGRGLGIMQDVTQISFRQAFVLYASAFNVFFLYTLVNNRRKRAQKVSAINTERDANVRLETKDFRCYNAAFFYRQQCVFLDPVSEAASPGCAQAVEVLQGCQKELEEYLQIVDETPAMMPTPKLVNAPPWLK
uniref:Uncharacterized protein n=1 Tax=Chromera velia CCMP2878 TaxID=1169474 RepID=A0A0G4I301_9ALVE|mmetsp:Transcript_46785/g.92372  ORF Transcript_46785/g.92372 Transcript_46785/m.92372 type:complete len:134 (+) Transcript_46785:285-686(+)|eukprot:Cvel_10540.t1-p1 / transcript=Cvel_10540.t1 / gene=Cvel_10540 / organism=Chromera_velia_CCMP2878 / gene_product=hypothetical protein / transcript_product=hypothetical protein / location=Cvel_scaffold638:22136-24876(+) / protein_length=133 / sequence_SO=supercontig / SO=protein_coding / is_pseudo=false